MVRILRSDSSFEMYALGGRFSVLNKGPAFSDFSSSFCCFSSTLRSSQLGDYHRGATVSICRKWLFTAENGYLSPY
jgi:hypothetical protein